jgi:uncharacterized protein with PIN domain
MGNERLKFIVDHNVGKIAKWLRMVGYNAVLFTGADDTDMVNTALKEDRILFTRDTQIVQRRVAINGQLKIILIKRDRLEEQIKQIVHELKLESHDFRPFTICLECNVPLASRAKEEVKNRVPPYVFKTQTQYMECPACHRIYWRGTHWQSMVSKIEKL